MPKIPAGAQVQNIKDIAARLGQAFDVLTGRAFSPGVPIQPVADAQEQHGGPRRNQFPIAANLVVRPRQEYPSLTPFQQLRNLSRLYEVASLCSATRTEQITGLEWSIVAKDKARQKELERDGTIGRVTDWWQSPDRELPFSDWLTMAATDVLEIDALSVYVRRTRGGQIYALEPMDGATIKPLIDDRGIVRGYQQILYGYPQSQYIKFGANARDEFLPLVFPGFEDNPFPQELIYRPRFRKTDNPYGTAPAERVILRINTALRKQALDLAYFTDGNIPDYIASPPDGMMNPDQVEQFEKWWNDLLAGDDAARRKIKLVPFALDLKETRPFTFETKLDEWMFKLTCAAYGVTPSEMGFTEQLNKASSESQENITYRKGIKPFAKWFKEFFDGITQAPHGLNEPDVEWQWHYEESEDNYRTAQADDIYLKDGVIEPNEVRAMRFAHLVKEDEEAGQDGVTVQQPKALPVPMGVK